MNTLKARWAARMASVALLATVGLIGTALAQSTAPPSSTTPPTPPSIALPSPINNLNSSQQVISITAGPNVTAEAGVDTVNFNATYVTPYVGNVIFLWVNTATGQIDFSGQTYSETAPRQNTSYDVVAWDTDTGNWGWSGMTINVTDTTAPQIWLLGLPTMQVAGGTPWFDPGVGVFDNEDGANVPITLTGQVNTNVVGVYTITYTATDTHNNSAQVTRTVDVFYSWSGFSQPVNMDGSSVFHGNGCIPLKFTLTGGNANLTSGITAHLYLAKMNNGIAGTEIGATCTGNSDSGNIFRYQNGTYMYNLDTKGLTAGTWQLTVDMGDGAIHAAIISLTK